ncbi:lysylphosphatidylglycerol synthase transmembrane domain-containing protein [Pseudomonas sp. TTU2014-080ASC]|uniref:lysylphosphatidylglycerol synthase transmembrane domain-containing protein n=1 Tax=Pseudomonas sp. TTU2014-080ASC TaxID=1729724 RepID=UPI0007183A81|nr:lysylphosphatidylglycerol synthase transmembrane domain-containing protein [Pseudomonas sp. TTU2014-080ASC]KRW60917.1 hypothetical protein AO726_06125 [Pseudomonas sp. TTU2014-080ASC]
MTSALPHLEGWRFRTLIISIILAAAGYLAFSLWGGWNDVVTAFIQIGTLGTLITLFMSLVNYGLRFGRWKLYLSVLGYNVPLGAGLRIYLSGFALTTTPGKAGEAFRGVLLKRYGVPFPTTFATFISERLSDLVAIVLLTLLGLAQYPNAHGIVIAGALAIVVMMACLSNQSLLDQLYNWALGRKCKLLPLIINVRAMLSDTRQCHRPRTLIISTILSLIAWTSEALAFYWALDWLGTDVPLSFAIFIYAVSMLAGALSFLPGGLGSAEAVMVTLLSFAGVSIPTAIAATVFIRLATLWLAVAIGLACLAQSRNEEVLSEKSS